MSNILTPPTINRALLGIEHDITVVYAFKPIEQYQERLSDLEKYLEYQKEFNKQTTVGSAKKSIADLTFRIDRLKNIIHAKQSYSDAEQLQQDAHNRLSNTG